jgi:hypothetical protein
MSAGALAQTMGTLDSFREKRMMVRLLSLTNRGFTMRRRFCAAVIAAAAMLMFAGVTQAAQHTTVTQLQITHGAFTEPEFDANPCSGAAIASFNAFGTQMAHETFFIEDGQVTEVWATFTETGKVSLTDANGVTYSGHFTVWGGFNLNERNTNNTFTLTVNLAGSDGSTIVAHEVQHFALNANGTVTVNFDTMRLTCG